MNRLSAHIHGWLLFLPAAVLLAAFTHYPAVATLWHSFLSTPKGDRPAVWVGLDNYQGMVEDPVFWQVLANNLWFALGTIPVSIALAMLMAVWVNGKLAGRGFLRMAFFTPTVLPMIAVANIWLFFYTPTYGLLEQFTGLFGLPSHNWLGSQSTALTCLIVVTVWKEAGFFMIFYLAALQSIPPSLAEAAAIEGAGRWYYFRRVVFPLLMGTNRGRYFLLTGQTLSANEAKDLGLVNEVLPRAQLLDRAWTHARMLMQRPPLLRRYARVLLTQDLKKRMQELLGYGLALEGLAATQRG